MSIKRAIVDLNSFGTAASKRRKAVGADELEKFAPGTIIKVKVKNFVTYALTEFTLSPSLNMIIGPNGTGKSTFVCAVCLGLAGAPTLLGRQKALAGFIKNGEQSAVVEITLKNKPGLPEIVIKREFFQSNKSDWFINNKSTSEMKVKAALKEMNIQLDNLCQFLPQERVADFAKLKPEELLEETERAIEIGLLEKHQELVRLDNERSQLNEDLETKSSEFNKQTEERKRFEEEARKYEEFQRSKQDLEDHERLMPYAKIQDLKVQQQEFKEKRDQLKRDWEEIKELAKPYESAASKFDDAITAITNEIHLEKNLQAKAQQKSEKWKQELAVLEDKNNKILGIIEHQKTRAEEKQRELESSQALLQKHQENLAKIQLVDPADVKEYKKQSSELFDKENEIGSLISDKESEIRRLKGEIVGFQDRITNLQRQFKSSDKIHVLEQKSNYNTNRQTAQVKKAVELLRTSAFSEYRGHVFEPPVVTLSATKEDYAAYLEEIVDNQTRFALTAVSREAYDGVSKEVFERHKLNVPFRYLSGRHQQGRLSAAQLNDLGFEGYLRDFVTGPDAVIAMLSETSYIHDIPVSGKGLTEEQLRHVQVPRNGDLLFKKFISGDLVYTLSRSNYGSRQVTIKTSQINMRPNFFSAGGLSEETKNRLNAQISQINLRIEDITNRRNGLKGELEELTTQISPLKNEKKHYEDMVRSANHASAEYEKLTQRSRTIKEKIEKLEVDANKDYTNDILKNQKRLKLVAQERMRILSEIAVCEIKCQEISQTVSLLNVKKFDEKNKKISVLTLTQGIQHEIQEVEKQYDEAKRNYQQLKNSDLRKELIEQTKKYSPEIKDRLNSLIVKYTEEGKFSEESVSDIIESLDAELKLLGTSSKSSVNTLERINEQLERLNEEIPNLQIQLKQITQNIKEIHGEWEPRLHEIVRKISDKFSSIFPTVGSAGQVRVAKADKYSEWRLEILVKFRDEADLRVLDSHSQSGGERAVSTVMYMISMQELTTSPFRVVDEINQGMDSRNERVVHRHMVQVACQEHTSQYFLITPKLLTDLYYSNNMRVHCIMAGPWTPNPSQHQEYLSLGATSAYT